MSWKLPVTEISIYLSFVPGRGEGKGLDPTLHDRSLLYIAKAEDSVLPKFPSRYAHCPIIPTGANAPSHRIEGKHSCCSGEEPGSLLVRRWVASWSFCCDVGINMPCLPLYSRGYDDCLYIRPQLIIVVNCTRTRKEIPGCFHTVYSIVIRSLVDEWMDGRVYICCQCRQFSTSEPYEAAQIHCTIK